MLADVNNLLARCAILVQNHQFLAEIDNVALHDPEEPHLGVLLGFLCETFTQGFEVCQPMPEKGLAASLAQDRAALLDRILQLFRLMITSGMVPVLCRPLKFGQIDLSSGVVQMLIRFYGEELPFNPYETHPLRGVLVSVQELCLQLLKNDYSRPLLLHGQCCILCCLASSFSSAVLN